MPTYLIEHLEPRLWKWCMIEYKHISKIVGKNNLWFTNIKRKSRASEELKKYGKVINESVTELGLNGNNSDNNKYNLTNACILDPEASETLTCRNSKQCDYFIFGGILGDDPPKKRTKPELTDRINSNKDNNKNHNENKNNNKFVVKIFNIGKKQLSTDNAVFVVKQIVDGKELKDIEFVEDIELETGKNESVVLPYRYPVVDGKPNISKELVNYLIKKKGF